MPKKRNKHHLNAIQPGYQLHWYEIRDILGQGGFGITYLAYDRNLAHEVAIKEYLPIDLSARAADGSAMPLSHDHVERYRWGLDRFIEEARTIGQFKHPNIVRVRNVFEANNTAYMVMDYELGETLQDILSRRKILDEADIGTVLHPIIDGMKLVHAHGFIHRDIKPANIFIRVDGDPVLLDFGSARQALEQSRANLTSLFSKGYAPIEQYNTQDEQGPWTDIYAVGATMYRAIAGVPPADAIDRSSAISIAGHDTYVTAQEVGKDRYSPALLEAIDYAMRFRRQDRPQSISEWQQVLSGRSTAAAQHFESTGEHPVTRPLPATMPAPPPEPAPAPTEALTWYLMAAEQGDSSAQATVASMYMKGVGTPVDEKAGFDWSMRAAKRGHLNSMFNLGEMYLHGLGVEQNLAEAFRWYRKAADKGHISAQINVGFMYGKGQGVERNDTEAYHWYRRAAESGNPNAQYNLGVIYSKGRGISRNVEEARKWYQRAAAQGDANAGRALARLAVG